MEDTIICILANDKDLQAELGVFKQIKKGTKNFMDKELIIHYTYQLNWCLPEDDQQDAMDWLVREVPRDQLSLIFPKYNKYCWPNAVEVVKRIGYPENETAFPKLVELFQDLNWPGALEAIDYFRMIDKHVVAKYIEVAIVQAEANNDEDWLYFLSRVCEELHIEDQDFKAK